MWLGRVSQARPGALQQKQILLVGLNHKSSPSPRSPVRQELTESLSEPRAGYRGHIQLNWSVAAPSS